MSFQYEPQNHIQHLEVAPRAEGVLDQREITIHSYQTTVPFDYDALSKGLSNAWLTPQIRFGVIAQTPMKDGDALNVVLGLQDKISVRTYDHERRRSLYYSWRDVIVDTVNVRYYRDENDMLRFKTTGGGRRITDDLLQEFNTAFLGIPKDVVEKRHFLLEKLRELCFGRFVDRLYMVRFSHPSGEEYRSIDHGSFHSRSYIDPQAERLHEINADTGVTLESFDSDIDVHYEDLAEAVRVRFFIRGLSGSLRLRFPKIAFKKDPKTLEEQAMMFYRLVDIAENSILDSEYYTQLPRSLDELDIELGMFPDMVDLTPFREVLTSADARAKFIESLDLGAPWQAWQPHLRALDELLVSDVIANHVAELMKASTKGNPQLAGRLLATCQGDPKMGRVGVVVALAVADEVQSIPAEHRAQVEESLLSWAIDQEQDTWDVDPESGEIMVLNLRWQVADLSLDVLPAVLWKLVGVLHARLVAANSDTVELLRRFNWCMTVAKGLPPNHSKLSSALRLVADSRVPSSIAEGAKVLNERVSDLQALDDAVLDQFGLPLWPCLTASRENGQVTLQNTGVGVALAVRAIPTGTLFSDGEASNACDLRPGESIELAVSGSPTTLDVRFSKFGTERRIELPITCVKKTACPSDAVKEAKTARLCFDWAKQIELWRATQRVLGDEDTPDRGTISKAVKAGGLESNGHSGRKCLVNVDSFKAWITKAKELANGEVLQIMDAVMSEIRSRKQ